MSFTVHRAGARFVSSREGSRSHHCFSFGPHYDPANTSFGPIVAVNDEVVEVGSGFDEHPHAGIDIVTYVVTGSLAHQDDLGRSAVLEAGAVGIQHAGSGIVHSERNAGSEPLRFVQTWVTAEAGLPPYATGVGTPERGQLVAVARLARATLYVGHLGAGDVVLLPEGPLLVFVATGDVALDGTVLTRGDSVRGSAVEVTVASDVELLVWSLTA